MKGNHRGDYSRVTFDPTKHYSSVRLQQGRVLLDTDWNDQVEIEGYRRETLAADLVGTEGGPADHAGFEIALRGALRFDGERQYLRIGGKGVSTFNGNAFSFELRIRPQSPTGTLVARFDRTEGQKKFRCRFVLALGEDGRLVLYRYGAEQEHLLTRAQLTVGRSYHIAVVSGRSSSAVYVNGERVGADRQGLPPGAGKSFLLAGALLRDLQPQRAYAGLLMELRIWNVELHASTLGRDLEQLTTDDRRELVGHWRFDRPPVSGQVEDLVGNNPAILGDGQEAYSPTFGFGLLTVGAGRYYVAGLMCENEREFPLDEQPDDPADALRQGELGQYLLYLDAWEHLVAATGDPGLYEVAMAGADTSTRSQILTQVRILQLAPGTPIDDRRAVTKQWQKHITESRHQGRLRARRLGDTEAPLDNHLYRVEIHHPDDSTPSKTTFKWSRHNGSVTYPVRGMRAGDSVVQLENPGQGSVRLAEGEWVELSDDRSILSSHAGPLHRIVGIDDSRLEVTLKPPPEIDGRAERHPLLRRWDHQAVDGLKLQDGAAVVETRRWLPLEAGVEVYFEADGPYRAGDYWWLPARTATEDIDWSRDETGAPLAEPPRGVAHHLALLAALDVSKWQLLDYRRIFRPLTEDEAENSAPTASKTAARSLPEASPEPAELSPASVSNEHLRDGTITQAKLAPGVGGVPMGFSILGESPDPPPGFVYTGGSLTVDVQAAWQAVGGLPRPDAGPLRSAALGGRIYSFLESGDVWEYDPSSHQWQSWGAMPEPRQGFAVAALGPRIYVAGGMLADGTPTGSVAALDPSQGWSACSDLTQPRSALALAALGGQLFAGGGAVHRRGGEAASDRAEAYDPSTDSWRRLADLPHAAAGLAAAAGSGRIHVCGGTHDKVLPRRERILEPWHWAYHPGHDRWDALAQLPGPRSGAVAATIGDRLYVVGGAITNGATPECLRYDAIGDYWHHEPSLPQAIAAPGAAAIGDRLYALGSGHGSAAVFELTVALKYFVHRRP